MNSEEIRHISSALEVSISHAGNKLSEIENNTVEDYYRDYDETLLEDDVTELEYRLTKCAVMMGIALDKLGLASSRRRFWKDWDAFVDKGLGTTKFVERYNVMSSKPLNYLRHVLDGLRTLTSTEQSSLETFQFNRLLEILRDTHVLVHRRSITPQKEHDVQHVMHDYLKVFFPDFSTNVTIPGAIKSFKPDSGIPSLKTAIEFKYASSTDEVTKALSGIYEDVSGYSGSQDWTHFISVVYMTGPWESVVRFNADLKRAKAENWMPIFVNGTGGRGTPKPAATKKSGPTTEE